MQYGLELVFVKNSHVFVDEYLKKPEFVDLMRRLGALGDGKDDNSKFQLIAFFKYNNMLNFTLFVSLSTCLNYFAGTLSPDEWEVAYLYSAFVLRKVETSFLYYYLFALLLF